MTAKYTFVYQLDVTYPEGSQEPGWEPSNWAKICDERGWVDESGERRPFGWPTGRRFLSMSGAKQWQKLLERLGAKVDIVRSLPIEWPGPSGAQAVHRSVQWAVAYGCPSGDPDECAGILGYDDEAEAREQLQWTVGGILARRTVTTSRWDPVERTDGGDSLRQQVQQARDIHYEQACEHSEAGQEVAGARAYGRVAAYDEVLAYLAAPEGE